MGKAGRKMKIGTWVAGDGAHVASWLVPTIDPHKSATFEHWRELGEICERGKLDFLFLADSHRVQYQRNPEAMSQMPATRVFEPLTLLSSLAVTTKHLGLVATATTTYNEPFHIARMFSSLDFLSGGRASWNVVTSSSPDEAPNFQAQKHMAHDDRYVRAKEFLEITYKLWDSWEDDAFPRDQESGTYLHYDKMHYTNHRTEHFSVKGPLTTPRPPQGRPVIFQAGSSDIGREFGAETADAIFTAQETIAGAKAFYDDVKGRMRKYGRKPEDMLIFVGVGPIVGETMAEAQAKFDFLQSKMTLAVSLQVLSEVLGGADLLHIPVDEPLTDLPPSDGIQSRRDLMLKKAIDEKMTLRELSKYVAGGRGHRQLIGTPKSIADDFEAWMDAGATDGFLLGPATLPGSLEDFVDLVVPELQRRGVFREEYEGTTMREIMGLPRPEHPAALARMAKAKAS